STTNLFVTLPVEKRISTKYIPLFISDTSISDEVVESTSLPVMSQMVTRSIPLVEIMLTLFLAGFGYNTTADSSFNLLMEVVWSRMTLKLQMSGTPSMVYVRKISSVSPLKTVPTSGDWVLSVGSHPPKNMVSSRKKS